MNSESLYLKNSISKVDDSSSFQNIQINTTKCILVSALLILGIIGLIVASLSVHYAPQLNTITISFVVVSSTFILIALALATCKRKSSNEITHSTTVLTNAQTVAIELTLPLELNLKLPVHPTAPSLTETTLSTNASAFDTQPVTIEVDLPPMHLFCARDSDSVQRFFPEEIILEILAYLPISDLASLARVNKQTYEDVQLTMIMRAKALGFNGEENFKEISAFLKNIFENVRSLVDENFIPPFCTPQKTHRRMFTVRMTEETVNRIKNISTEKKGELQQALRKAFDYYLFCINVDMIDFNMIEVLRFLGLKIDINEKKLIGLLFLAITMEKPHIINWLIKGGVNVNEKNDRGQPALLVAIFDNNFGKNKQASQAIIAALLAAKANPNIPDPRGWYPLNNAISNGDDIKIVELLLQHGANPNILDLYGGSLLQTAIEKSNLKLVELLLQHGANPNILDERRKSLLQTAIEKSNLKLTELLLQHGADLNILDSSGNSLLKIAIEKGNIEILQLLLNYGADINAKRKGKTILIHALFPRNFLTFEILKILLEAKADPNIPDKEGRYPLLLVAETGNVEMIQLLFNYGADINAKTRGLTPLDYALSSPNINRFNNLKFFLEMGIDPNNVPDAGWSPLHLAAYLGYPDEVKLLLQYGAKVNAFVPYLESNLDKSINNRFIPTPLCCAIVQSGNTKSPEATVKQVVEYLLKAGADPNLAAHNGSPPLHFAAQKGMVSVVDLLLKHKAEMNALGESGNTALHFAIRAGQKKVVKLLLKNGADPNIPNGKGNYLLQFAIERDDVELMHLLLKSGADKNVTIRNQIALFYAWASSKITIFTMLLTAGADPNIPDREGNYLLHLAVEKGDIGLTQLLLDCHAHTNLRVKGKTALYIALSSPLPEVAKLVIVSALLKANADPNIPDEKGDYPLDLASRIGSTEISKQIVDCLLNAGADPHLAVKSLK